MGHVDDNDDDDDDQDEDNFAIGNLTSLNPVLQYNDTSQSYFLLIIITTTTKIEDRKEKTSILTICN